MLSRKQRERARHKREILEAALEVFAQKGYHKATMQEIARKAEFAVGTLYRFFPSKKALYEALVLTEAQKFHSQVMDAFKNLPADPFQALKQVLKVKIKAVEKQLIFLKVYLSELWEARFRGGLTQELQKLYEEYLENLAYIIKDLTPYPLTPKRFAAIIDSLLSTLIIEAVEHGERLPTAEEVLSLFKKPLLYMEGKND